MKVILAFDSFKGSLTAEQATNAVAMGIREIFPTAEIICLPMADGGEGTTEMLVRYTRAKWSTCKVNDSLMRPIFVNYAIEENQRIALMEMAEVAGLTLLQPNEQKPMKTTTFGVGEMILNALKAGVKHILIGIGGSATSDGGAGMLAALGAKFYINNQLVKYPKGSDLIHLTSVDLSLLSVFQDIQIEVLCDVNNPLYGYNGAPKRSKPI